MPLKVFYSHDIFSGQNYGGISRYFVELIRHLPSEVQPFVLCRFHENELLASLPKQKTTFLRFPPHTRFLRLRVNEFFQNRDLNFEVNEILHQTYFFRPPVKGSQKLVITIHDMIHEKFPESFKVGNQSSMLKRQFCEAADHIISVSESTKKDLINYFNVPENKITIIHHGVSKLSSRPKSNHIHPKPFLLFVGSRHGYKNFLPMLEAFRSSEKLLNKFDWICYGGGAFNPTEKLFLNQNNLQDKVFFKTGNDDLLAEHYMNAVALIYPSLYEGFGLPLLEAMNLRCPVICSKTSSLPEVGGDAVEYFDPSDIRDMALVMERVLFDSSRLNELIVEGLRRKDRYTWQKAALKTYDVYKSVKGLP